MMYVARCMQCATYLGVTIDHKLRYSEHTVIYQLIAMVFIVATLR